MSITLGGISLPDLVPSENLRFGDSRVKAIFAESRAYTPIIFEQHKGYVEFDLTGGPQSAWIKYSTLVSLQSIASVPGAEYVLSYEGVLYNTRFRNWDQPVIEADPLVIKVSPGNNDLYNNVVIRLITII